MGASVSLGFASALPSGNQPFCLSWWGLHRVFGLWQIAEHWVLHGVRNCPSLGQHNLDLSRWFPTGWWRLALCIFESRSWPCLHHIKIDKNLALLKLLVLSALWFMVRSQENLSKLSRVFSFKEHSTQRKDAQCLAELRWRIAAGVFCRAIKMTKKKNLNHS